MSRSRRDSQGGADAGVCQQAEAKRKDRVVFQQVTIFRLNPLGVRCGSKDAMVV